MYYENVCGSCANKSQCLYNFNPKIKHLERKSVEEPYRVVVYCHSNNVAQTDKATRDQMAEERHNDVYRMMNLISEDEYQTKRKALGLK